MFTLSVITSPEEPYQNQITIKGMIKLMKGGYFHCADKGKASYVLQHWNNFDGKQGIVPVLRTGLITANNG
jgi:hypothetical protein